MNKKILDKLEAIELKQSEPVRVFCEYLMPDGTYRYIRFSHKRKDPDGDERKWREETGAIANDWLIVVDGDPDGIKLETL